MSNLCNVNLLLQEEAVNYYTNLEAKLKEEYRKEREKVNTNLWEWLLLPSRMKQRQPCK